MSIDLDRFCFIVLFMNPTAVVLSTCNEVGGWSCPSSVAATFIGIPSCALVYVAPISASAADAMTFLSIFATCVEIVLLRCVFTVVRLAVGVVALPSYSNLSPPADTQTLYFFAF